MPGVSAPTISVALLGLPNVGKTTLFNQLCRQTLHTSNFHGTTQEAQLGGTTHEKQLALIDLPGVYSLMDGSPESGACSRALEGLIDELPTPDVACVVLDTANLTRCLKLFAEVRRRGLPTIVLISSVGRHLIEAGDPRQIEQLLGVPVVLAQGRSAQISAELARAAQQALEAPVADAPVLDATRDLAAELARLLAPPQHRIRSDLADSLLLHPVFGFLVFAIIMWLLFWSVFTLAAYPMDWIDAGFGQLAAAVQSSLPPGPIADLLANGIIGGVGATLVFLPQIAMLFFLISLLEQSGYLARGALLADRLLRPFGLPGTAFVPLLSAHACAIPAIVACRTIRDIRERVATILVAPFMSCSARLPVYALLVSFLFVNRPTLQAAAFLGCYALGIIAAMTSAFVLRHSILKGPASATAMELPRWRAPSLHAAVRAAATRSGAFLRKAGTNILVIMVALWWLSSYPTPAPSAEVRSLQAQAAAATDPQHASELQAEADRIYARESARASFMGRIGRAVEPAFHPLGYDWQISIGVMTSFAAREVFVSTMSVVTTGSDQPDASILDNMRKARRDDGSPLFNRRTLWSLMVFYVLAMQCLPTLAVTAREAGGVKWALLQLGWMSGLAYVAALIVSQLFAAGAVA